MTEFFDTSVLIAAHLADHPHHEPSIELFARTNPKRSACAAHTLAEVYATLTRMPPPHRAPPDEAQVFLGELRSRLALITLGESEYLDTLERAAEERLVGGMIYDALLLACAAKAKAASIYTWNVKHFRSVRPDLADRIRTP